MIPPGSLRDRVGDLRQFASIRLIELADGPERGVRALSLSSGGGLDAWLLVDRSFDIGPLWHHGRQIAWQAPTGFRSPFLHNAEAEAGRGFNRSFSGFLVTCGLEHIRAPGDGSPQHGRLPFTPGRLLAYGEDFACAEPILFCEGEVIQARYGGEALRLRRRIEVPIGGAKMRILDEVSNLNAAPQAHAMLYHFNLGWPAIDAGSRIDLDGEKLMDVESICGEEAVPQASCASVAGRGFTRCRVGAPEDTTSVTIGFDTSTLPFLQTWHDFRPGQAVQSIEPCTSMRKDNGASAGGVILGAREMRRYRLEVELASRAA
jgi:hypothetical protein